MDGLKPGNRIPFIKYVPIVAVINGGHGFKRYRGKRYTDDHFQDEGPHVGHIVYLNASVFSMDIQKNAAFKQLCCLPFDEQAVFHIHNM
jgi:hypothetical protein